MPPRSGAARVLRTLEPDYTVLEEIGRGSTSVVFRARDNVLGREVAIKVLQPQLRRNRAAATRFVRRAQGQARVAHPGAVDVCEVRRLNNGQPALVMRYVRGEVLGDLLQREGPLASERVEQVLRDVGGALAAAHSQDVVHGALDAAHVMLDTDTGAALVLGLGAPAGEVENVAPGSAEQMIHAALDRQKDLYHLALLGWQMLRGEADLVAEPDPDADPLSLRLWQVLGPAVEGRHSALQVGTEEFVAAITGGAAAPTSAVPSPVERLGRSVVAAAAGRTPAWLQPGRLGLAAAVAAAVVLFGAGTLLLAAPGVRSLLTDPEQHARGAAAPAVGEPTSGAVPHALPPVLAMPPLSEPAGAALPDAAAPHPVGGAGAQDSEAEMVGTVPEATPAVPASVVTAGMRLVAGGMHTCASAPDGTAFCWGGNDRGQLGTVGAARSERPARIGEGVRFAALSAGVAHTCGVTSGGEAFCWGGNETGQLGSGGAAGAGPHRVEAEPRFAAVQAGMLHTCGLTRSGSVLCWGDGSIGQLGNGEAAVQRIPVEVAAAGPFRALASSWNHACALRSDGRMVCWGHNAFGQLGDGTRTDRAVPVATAGDARFRAVAAGSAHTCALATDGTPFCWGRNTYGELGDGSRTDRMGPVRVRGGRRFAGIVAGSAHTCGLTANGEAFCWGRNVHGQLGDGSTSDRATPAPVRGGLRFVALEAGGAAHTCGTTVEGESFCWGYNVEGQLGDGTRTVRTAPTRVRFASEVSAPGLARSR